MKIKAIFYDFDGVIKDSTDIKTQAFYELYLPFGKEIAQKAMQHHLENGGMSRFEKFKLYHQSFLNKKLNEVEINEWANRFSELVLKKVIESDYVNGAYQTILEGNEQYQQFIVTGTPQNEIEFIVKQLNIGKYFSAIGGSPKNKIEISKQFLNEYHLSPKEVIFVGDAITDYNCAKHFGFTFYLRQHPENKELFKNIETPAFDDLTNLLSFIKAC
ncbi:MAG: HAD family hydrolase [Bacteroidia bacterium]|nr:HAD family hydrolase [Bacteroidia bacterium]